MTDTQRHSVVIPLRYVAAVEPLREFYTDRLGFVPQMGVVGKDGALDFAIVQRDGAMLMLARPNDPAEVTRGPLEIYVETDDVDGFHERIRDSGVPIARDLSTQWWGDRSFAVVDPAGHLIWFWQTVAEMAPPPGLKVV